MFPERLRFGRFFLFLSFSGGFRKAPSPPWRSPDGFTPMSWFFFSPMSSPSARFFFRGLSQSPLAAVAKPRRLHPNEFAFGL